jgi:two-component system heavy metal sensor histidine kinase CusS
MRMRARMSLTLRLTLLFAAASTTVLLLLGYLIANSVEKHFEEQDMEGLTGKLELAQYALEKVRSKADLATLPLQLADSLIGHHGLAMLVVTPGGETLFATHGASFPSGLTSDIRTKGIRTLVWRTPDGHPYRGISKLASTGISGAPDAVISVGTDISEHEHFMAAFKTTLSMVVVLAAILTGFLGWIAVRRGLAPLRSMRREVEGITARRLDARLSAASVPVELAELAETLNGMLARLEDSFQRLSNFSSDLAHELRTPVSNLLTQTQVTLSKARTADKYCEILASNAEEFERLARIIADMLFLAKSDNELVIPTREPVDLIDEVKSVFEFYEALSEEKSIQMAFSGAGRISGDRLMVRRAINNLLSNAVRHTYPGGRISVHVEEAGTSHVVLCVENTGDSVPPEHLQRIFERFYRVDFSRQRQSDGAGLGLAITRSILRAHGGDTSVSSENGTTSFYLRFLAG